MRPLHALLSLLSGTFLLVSLAVFLSGAVSQPAPTPKPNILFIIADDAGPDMSIYGRNWCTTPAFDRIAREGLLFTRAYTPNAKCAPSRACILTGRNSWQLDAAANHSVYFPTKFKTYQEALGEAGYVTGYTGKGYGPGKALTDDGQPRPLLGRHYNQLTTKPPTPDIGPTDYAANFAGFVQQAAGKPWSFWVGFQEPHRSYEYGSGVKKGGKRPDMIDRVPTYWPDSLTIRNDLLDYAFEIEYMDSHVARILKTLEETGQLDNTIIVVTSDHGMPFPRVKGNPYEHANRIPMAIRWPGGIKTANRRIDDYVSFVDLAPTFLQAAGLPQTQSGMQPTVGTSLFDVFGSAKAGQTNPARNFVLVGQESHGVGRPNDEGYPIRGMHKDGMLYLRNYEPARWPAGNPEVGYLNCDGSPTKSLLLNLRRAGKDKSYWQTNFGKRPAEELYDVRRDPDCVNNLMKNPRYKTLAKQLEAEMVAKLKAQDDLRQRGYGYLYDQYPVSEPTVRSYYEKDKAGNRVKATWVNETDYESEPLD
jgi:N-sulfoglucosamine sulfohydrolase